MAEARGSRERPAVLAGIFALALGLRLLHLAAFWRGPFSPSLYLPIDAREHHTWAIDWLNGSWPGHIAFERPPLFTYFLGAVYALTGPRPLAVLLLQALLGAAGCLLVYGIGREIFDDRRMARVAALLTALCGTLLYFDAQLLSASLDVFLGLALLWLLLLAARRGSPPLWLAAGLVAGLSALNRGAVLLFAPCVLFWAARLARPERPTARRGAAGLGAAALFALAMLLPIAPVSWHNARYDAPAEGGSLQGAWRHLLGGDFVPIASNAGLNFYLGNHRSLRALNRVDHPEHLAVYERIRLQAVEAGIESYAEANRYMVRETLADMRRWPGDWMALMGIKLAELCNGTEIPRNTSLYADRNDSPVLAALLWRLGLALPSGLLIPLGFLGIAGLRRDWRRQFLVFSALGSQALFVLAFFVTARYRLPMLPLLSLYAARAGVDLVDAWRSGSRARAERLTGVLALLLVLCNLPIVAVRANHHWMEHYNLAVALLEHERRDQAESELRRAAQLNPQGGDAVLELCVLLLDSGRSSEALPFCQRAVESEPESARAQYRLGMALEAAGRASESIPHYREAVRLAPEAREAGTALRRLGAPPAGGRSDSPLQGLLD